MTSCNAVGSGVKVISKCCKDLLLAKNKTQSNCEQEENSKKSDYSKGGSLLPLNSWDTKMMIW